MSDNYELLIKPLAFTAMIGAGTLVACTIWQYESSRSNRPFERLPPPSNVNNLDGIQNVIGDLSHSEDVFWPICIANGAVWMAWKAPNFASFMVNNFSTSPTSRKICTPLLLSTFSHYSLTHLVTNMMTLHSLMPAATAILGKEEFVSFYLTSGVIASLGSHLHKMATGNSLPSLGASGAVAGVIGLVCTKAPQLEFGVVCLPQVQFSAETALKCLIAVDLIGVISGWKYFDHAAHLTGCLFGIAFAKFGLQPVEQTKNVIAREWHRMLRS